MLGKSERRNNKAAPSICTKRGLRAGAQDQETDDGDATFPESHEERVYNGRAWEDFCDGLKAAGQVIFRPEAPDTMLDRAEGWRWLTRLTRAALDMAVEYGDPAFPGFYQLSNHTIRIGADNPDNTYFNATISAEYDYKISGYRGTAPILTFGSKAIATRSTERWRPPARSTSAP
ncbi:hypothetical protein ACFSTI_04520 [Rhizorhabdus histidinilytica]